MHAPTCPILNSSTNTRFHPTMPTHPAIRGMEVHFACQVPVWTCVWCRYVQKTLDGMAIGRHICSTCVFCYAFNFLECSEKNKLVHVTVRVTCPSCKQTNSCCKLNLRSRRRPHANSRQFVTKQLAVERYRLSPRLPVWVWWCWWIVDW